MARRLLVPLWATAALVACATSSVPQVTEPDVVRAQLDAPDVTKASLERGRSLYMARCGNCHEPFEPASRSLDEWHHEVAEMRVRAALDPAQEELVLSYLATFSRR